MNHTFDVIVVGGGIVGLSAAIAMRQRGFSVAVMDAGQMKVDTSSGDPRVYAINQASEQLLQALCVWEHLNQERLSPYRHMHVWDAASGAHIDFDARLLALDRLGTIIEESILKEALLHRIHAEGVVCFSQSKVTAVESNIDGVCLHHGEESSQATLLMVADGASSTTRERLGVSLTHWSYHQEAVVATVQTEKSHEQTASQVFNSDGPLAFLPLKEAHQSSIVWSTTPAQARLLMDLSEEAFNAQLTDAFAERLGACTLLGRRYAFPLEMRHATAYSGPHWLLMGDAAHTIHPLAGLGLNLGLADLSVWLQCMDANRSRDIWSTRTLSAYQRQRKHAVWQKIALMEGLKAIFANPFPPFVKLRGLGLSTSNALSPLKRFFIEQAIGA